MIVQEWDTCQVVCARLDYNFQTVRMQTAQEAHRMRLSIDIKSIKDNDFIGQVFAKYGSYPEIGISRPFRTSPLLQLSTPKVEEIFPNGFSSYYFNSTAATLTSSLSSTVQIQLWHSDRMKKDLLIGVVKLEMSRMVDSPVRKTKTSYARVFDAYMPVDELNEEGQITRKVAAMRVLVYLEDLGPVGLLRQKQEELGLGLEIGGIQARDVDQPRLPSQNRDLSVQDRHRQIQLNQLQYKVVWELQTWRKAEQAKTRIHLKQKEVEFLGSLAQEQRKQDFQKEKHFKKIEGNLTLLENKLRAKSAELQKREQKLVLLEQQTQNKVTEMSRYLLLKDEQLETVKKRSKEDKTNISKEKGSLQVEIQRLKSQTVKLKMDLEQANKEDDKAPLVVMRNELNNRITENKMLLKQIDKVNEVKKLFEESYQKMRNEVIHLKKQLDSKNSRTDSLKTENQILKSNLKLLQEQLNLANQQNRGPTHQSPYYDRNHDQDRQMPVQRQFSNQLQRLKHERQQYLNTGAYTPTDPLIKEYDKLIAMN